MLLNPAESAFLAAEREAARFVDELRRREPLTLAVEADEEGAPRVVSRPLPIRPSAVRRAASHRALAKAG